jgi:hypothetical protein
MRYHFYFIPLLLLYACQSQPESISIPEKEISETSEDSLAQGQNLINEDSIAMESSEFNWNEKGFNTVFDVRAYINDPDDTEPTNMRNSPNGKIIQKLPQGEDYMFHILGQNNGWFQIKDLVCFSEEIEITQTTGWIHGSVVGASNRVCDKKGSPVYKFPAAEDSLLVGYVPMESSIRIKQLYFDFVEIDFKTENGKSKTGWMHQDCVCGNPVTTCP